MRRTYTLGIAALLIVTAGCGQKAAPDIDPVPKKAPSSTTTTTMPATTTTIDPGTLPQTEDKPNVAAPELKARVDTLWQAILTGDTSQAASAFFPLAAYQQVKDLKDPASDYRNRLIATFNREITTNHDKLTTQLAQQKKTAADAVFVGIDVPAAGVQWIKPGGEYNKIGYYRVFDSKLSYTIAGKPYSFPVKSMISWRGQFYVVHLTSYG